MGLLSKKDIKQAKPLRYKVIPLPAWGGDVRIRSMVVGEIDAWPKDEEGHVYERLAVRFLVDKDGASLYELDDWDQLSGMDRESMEKLAEEIIDLNGMTKAVQDELEKNSKSPADDGSDSPSPGTSESPSTG